MKKLFDIYSSDDPSYVYEDLGRGELMDYIKAHIDDINLVQARRIYSILSVNPKQDEFIKKLTELGAAHVADNIYAYFDRYGQGSHLVDYVVGPEDKKLSASDILSSPDGNLVDIISSKTKFTKTPILRLAKETTTGGVKVGEFEFVLRIFMQYINVNDKRGDIVSNGLPIELKCGSARLAGAHTGQAYKIRLVANNMLRDRGLEEVSIEEFNNGSKDTTIEFFENLYNRISKEQDAKSFISHLLVDSYTSQYEGVRDKEDMRSVLYDVAESVLFSGSKIDTTAIVPMIATVVITMYHLLEGFEYIVIIDKTTGNFRSICFSDMSHQYLRNIVFDMFKKGKIFVKTLPKETDNMYGKGIQVEYHK